MKKILWWVTHPVYAAHWYLCGCTYSECLARRQEYDARRREAETRE